ncbi:MAG: hypothetical protein GQ583_07690 [Methyloprofundus sp.]|nr:hypothetical protein [Methyloprofundus sp.]
MNYLTVKKQQGVGLMEILVTTVVVAVGLLAVASLQGDFILSSADSKARAEALVLAERKIESLRNNVVRDDGDGGGYEAIANSADVVTESPITGENAVFTRSWVINEGGTAKRKKVSVLVTWDSDGGVDSDGDGSTIDDDERVNVVTEMAFDDPAKSALYAGPNGASGTAAVPSPRQNASEDINAASEDVIGTDLQITAVGSGDGTAGTDQQVQVNPDGTLLTLSQVASGSFFYTAAHSDYPAKIEAGVIAVFICHDADDDPQTVDVCTHIQNHFGGVVHRVKGTVYSTSLETLSDRLVAWTSSETHACYNGAVTEGSGSDRIDEMPYECIYAGNCDATVAGTRTASSGGLPHAVDEGCFVDAVVSDEQINNRGVGPGGEYGDMGLLGLEDSGPHAEQVCFLENTAIADSTLLNANSGDAFNENYLYAVTKRLYVTRRVKRNDNSTSGDTSDDFNDHKNEGINRSYTNHNFFIADRNSGPRVKLECREQAIDTHAKELAPRDISRILNEGTDNAVFDELVYFGGVRSTDTNGNGVIDEDDEYVVSYAHTLIGEVTGSATTKLKFFIPEVGACYLDNNLEDVGTAATAYACVIGSSATSASIIGSSNEHKDADPSVFAVCSRETNTDSACPWLSSFTDTYDDGGTGNTSCTTPWGTEIDDAATVSAYAPSDCTTLVTRTCNSGTLAGGSGAIYPATDTGVVECQAAASAGVSCALGNWGRLADGATQDVYTAGSVLFSNICPDPITVSCSDGTLTSSSDTIFQNCTVDAPVNCTTVWGVDVTDGGSITGYEDEEVINPEVCVSESQVCTTGVLLPNNYTFGACTAVDAVVNYCDVPNYYRWKKRDMPATWNSTGPGSISNNIAGRGGARVSGQTPSAGESVDCTSVVTVF